MTRTIEPIDTVEHVECVASPSARRCQCKVCSKTYAGGAIVTLRPHDDIDPLLRHPLVAHVRNRAGAKAEDARCDFACRAIYCDHCNHVQVWFEAVGAELTGIALTEPVLLRTRDAVRSFLKRHPQATGVTQR